ncbi:hypothetical protein BJX76DRAFT_341744 [Aspergillus varians]
MNNVPYLETAQIRAGFLSLFVVLNSNPCLCSVPSSLHLKSCCLARHQNNKQLIHHNKSPPPPRSVSCADDSVNV